MFLFFLLYILPALAGVIWMYINWSHSYWKRKGVDYIEPEFFFGNTGPLLKKKENRLNLFKNFYNHFKSRGKKFGGVYSNLTPTIILTDLDIIKSVLQTDFSHFVNHDEYVNEKDDPLSGNVLFLKDEKWKTIRAKLTPTFTTGKMKMMFETVTACTSDLNKLLDSYAIANNPVDIKQILLLFGTDIIASVAFGLEVKSMENPDTEFRKKFVSILEPNFIQIVKHLITTIVPHWILIKIGFRVSRHDIEDFFRKVITDVIDYREKNNVYRKDFLQLLIEIKNTGKTLEDKEDKHLISKTNNVHLSLNEILAQCVTFYVAGFETSSTAMTFTLLELAQNEDVQEKLRDEIDTVLNRHNGQISYDALMEMEYLEQVLNEALRKHSPASVLTRVCNTAYKIPGTDVVIDPGTLAAIPVHGLHWDPDYFPEPQKFNPDRFSKANKSKIPQFSYLPFGEGPRACIGIRFGKLESKVGICAIVQKFKITLSENTQTPIKYNLGRIPAVEGGVWLNLKKI